jgi:KamA family protein
MTRSAADHRFRAVGRRGLDRIEQLRDLGSDHLLSMKAVAAVLPFRTNQYVIDQLIDWNAAPDDPMFQLTFPQPGMLEPADLAHMRELIASGADEDRVSQAAHAIQWRLNPHPAGQVQLNVPRRGGRPIPGIQHKYRETVLFFPRQGQTCHAYCTYCFRWPQFAGLDDDLKFAADEAAILTDYLRDHPEVTSVLITGGDPLVMKSAVLRRYIEPLLSPDLAHVTSIRIGSKALAYWPYRLLTDPDADDLLRLFEEVAERGRTLALMAHYSHPRELSTQAAQRAVHRARDAGAVIRCQAPLVRHVNDEPRAWATMWNLQVRLGMIPYYMFVERDTGARRHFEVPLARAVDIFRAAFSSVSGLARTARGPSMSTTPGKVLIEGTAEIAGERVFVLRFLQARDPRWVGRPFFAAYDPAATWFSQLVPAFGRPQFFFSDDHDALSDERRLVAWGESSLPGLRPRVWAPADVN